MLKTSCGGTLRETLSLSSLSNSRSKALSSALRFYPYLEFLALPITELVKDPPHNLLPYSRDSTFCPNFRGISARYF